MTEIVITVRDEGKVDFLLQLLKLFDFVTHIEVKHNQAENSVAHIAKHIGELEGIITTDELMAITRGE